MIKEYIMMALRDLGRRKGRTILTSLGITIGTLLIVTMLGLGTGLNDFMVSMVNNENSSKSIQIQPIKYISEEDQFDIDYSNFEEDYFNKIDNETIRSLKETGKIESVKAIINYSADTININGKKYNGVASVVGYSLDEGIFSKSYIKSIRDEVEDEEIKPIKSGRDIQSNTGEVIVGETLLEGLNLNIEDILNKEIEIPVSKINGMKIDPIIKKYTVVGIIDKNFHESNSILMSAEDAAELKGISTLQKEYLKSRGYDNMEVIVENIADVEEVSKEVKKLDYLYVSTTDMAKDIDDSLKGLSTGFAVLGIIVLIVAAIGIINTMSMAVLERTKSIGVMKSVGANSNAIRTIFLVQSSIIGVIGGAVGILLALGINSIIEFFINQSIANKSSAMAIKIGLPWYYIVGILIFAGMIALVSGIYPANKASKLDPIQALRG